MVMTEKIIELISGKLGGEAPTNHANIFFFYVYISGGYILAVASQKF